MDVRQLSLTRPGVIEATGFTNAKYLYTLIVFYLVVFEVEQNKDCYEKYFWSVSMRCCSNRATSKSILDAPFSFTEPFVKTTINAEITIAIIVGNVTLGLRYHGAFSPL